jgi:spermidine synthase
MKPTSNVAETTAPDGSVFRLVTHDGEFFLYLNDRQVMSTTLTNSELLLADNGCDFRDSRKSPRVLIGGLGLGFSLRRALEITDSDSSIEVAELLPEIIDWNKQHLNGLNDDILADPRTKIFPTDVYELIEKATAKKSPRYDAILLDVDDGPSSLLQPHNAQIYKSAGINLIKRALTPRGIVAFWSAGVEPTLLRNLRSANFDVEEIPVARHPRAKQLHHRIYLAERKD